MFSLTWNPRWSLPTAICMSWLPPSGRHKQSYLRRSGLQLDFCRPRRRASPSIWAAHRRTSRAGHRRDRRCPAPLRHKSRMRSAASGHSAMIAWRCERVITSSKSAWRTKLSRSGAGFRVAKDRFPSARARPRLRRARPPVMAANPGRGGHNTVVLNFARPAFQPIGHGLAKNSLGHRAAAGISRTDEDDDALASRLSVCAETTPCRKTSKRSS